MTSAREPSRRRQMAQPRSATRSRASPKVIARTPGIAPMQGAALLAATAGDLSRFGRADRLASIADATPAPPPRPAARLTHPGRPCPVPPRQDKSYRPIRDGHCVSSRNSLPSLPLGNRIGRWALVEGCSRRLSRECWRWV
ncbi:transposase [Streptomyces sp. NPDC088748]|uniref:transposase n=1 Tax=Streptomyces sp. NPDC088748 TaxID=3365887 RepID=UPI003800C4AF